MNSLSDRVATCGYKLKPTQAPLHSPMVQLLIGELVLRWVLTRDTLLLYLCLFSPWTDGITAMTLP
ncbi:hypothetical protein BJ508DRAFT_74771 [Ascobolus immersus RN42]|uniref:Uncharacterized protein n=1 Tax=Ascobolus immersus RN42 TaxID=1160509 RepID=A0A3N4IGB3_ASCIM|nr:hypothetical protein BJ508DRAFT_74771 [Ascobolus immersus RN42]